MKSKKKAASPPKMAFDFCASVHVLVPKPYDWLSSKPAISIFSASKNAFGELQFGHVQDSGEIPGGMMFGSLQTHLLA